MDWKDKLHLPSNHPHVKWVFPSSFEIFSHGTMSGGTRPQLSLHEKGLWTHFHKSRRCACYQVLSHGRTWLSEITRDGMNSQGLCEGPGEHGKAIARAHPATEHQSRRSRVSESKVEVFCPLHHKLGYRLHLWVHMLTRQRSPDKAINNGWVNGIIHEAQSIKTGHLWVETVDPAAGDFVGEWVKERGVKLACAPAGRAQKKSEELAFLSFPHCPLFFLFQSSMCCLHTCTAFHNAHILPSKWAGRSRLNSGCEILGRRGLVALSFVHCTFTDKRCKSHSASQLLVRLQQNTAFMYDTIFLLVTHSSLVF